MKNRFTKALGISLIIFSWILWGVIFILPYFKLSKAQYEIIYPILFIGTNIFWVEAILIGKEYAKKYAILLKFKTCLKDSAAKRMNRFDRDKQKRVFSICLTDT